MNYTRNEGRCLRLISSRNIGGGGDDVVTSFTNINHEGEQLLTMCNVLVTNSLRESGFSFQVFKELFTMTNSKHLVFIRYILNFSCLVRLIEDERTNKVTDRFMMKIIVKNYNIMLNYIRQHLCADDCDHEIARKRKLIQGMCFLHKDIYHFRKPSQVVQSQDKLVKISHRAMNYDGLRMEASSICCIRVPESTDRATGRSSGGVAFSFESRLEAYHMFMNAVDGSTFEDLVKVTSFGSPGGGLSTPIGKWILRLSVLHGNSIAVIPSTSPKITTCLPHKSGLYSNFKYAVQRKIKILLNTAFNNPDFAWLCIDCFRPECSHWNVFSKVVEGSKSIARCTQCKIAEFCLKCTKASHGGDCYRLDEASQLWEQENTRPCPMCSAKVEKDGGCNHMACRCGAHFCWTCNQLYELAQINDHYNDINPFGTCVGAS